MNKFKNGLKKIGLWISDWLFLIFSVVFLIGFIMGVCCGIESAEDCVFCIAGFVGFYSCLIICHLERIERTLQNLEDNE